MKIRTAVIAAFALGLCACHARAFGAWDVVRGNGEIGEESRDVGAFTGIANRGSGLVRFMVGTERRVTVEADTNILPYVRTEVRGGVLVLSTEPGASISPTRLVYRITAPDLRSLAIEGSGDVLVEKTRLATDRLDITIEGSGDVEAGVEVDELSVEVEGSGDVVLTGAADDARFRIEGSGDIEAADLAVVDAEVTIRGSGSVTLQASRTIDVDIAGSGDVRYRGGAKVTVRDSGSGRVTEF